MPSTYYSLNKDKPSLGEKQLTNQQTYYTYLQDPIVYNPKRCIFKAFSPVYVIFYPPFNFLPTHHSTLHNIYKCMKTTVSLAFKYFILNWAGQNDGKVRVPVKSTEQLIMYCVVVTPGSTATKNHLLNLIIFS